MAETIFQCDMLSWPFMDTADGQMWSIQAGAIDGEMRQQNFDDSNIYRSQFLAASDFFEEDFASHLSAKSLTNLNPFQPSPIENTTFDNTHQLHDFNTTASSRIQEFDTTKCQFIESFPESVGAIIRPTSQLATERALYMNTRRNQQSARGDSSSQASFVSNLPPNLSPDLSHCSSPSTSHTNESEDDPECGNFHLYSLPDGFPLADSPQPNTYPLERRKQKGLAGGTCVFEDDCLTPLEMPDGSTRLTSNWLPVDPEGGFTIADTRTPSVTHDGPPGGGDIFDVEPLQYGEDAFFSVDSSLSALGV